MRLPVELLMPYECIRVLATFKVLFPRARDLRITYLCAWYFFPGTFIFTHMEQLIEIKAPSDDEFKRWFAGSKAVDSTGKPLVLYHGSSKVGRIDKFRKSRATSGPMAYFTDDPAVASSYSTSKRDTSYKEPDSYDGWFLYKVKRENPVKLSFAWNLLSPTDKTTMLNNLYTVGYTNRDDGDGEIINGTISPVGKDSIELAKT